MSALSTRQIIDRSAWRPLRQGEDCGHHDRIYLLAGDADHVARVCFFCGRPFAPAEPRCLALIADGSRRCYAPGRYDGMCRAHQGWST